MNAICKALIKGLFLYLNKRVDKIILRCKIVSFQKVKRITMRLKI